MIDRVNPDQTAVSLIRIYAVWSGRSVLKLSVNLVILFHNNQNFTKALSYDVASGSEITPCNKIDKPLVVYRF